MTIQSKEQAKAKASALQRFFAGQGQHLPTRKALDAIAVTEGLPNWNTLSARLPDVAKSHSGKAKSETVLRGSDELVAVPRTFVRTVLEATQSMENKSPVEDVQQRLHQAMLLVDGANEWACVGSAVARKSITETLLTFGYGEDFAREVRSAMVLPADMSKRVYLALVDMDVSMGMAVAQGHDCVDGFDDRHDELGRLLDATSWTMHPDYGCVRMEQLEELDRQADLDLTALRAGQSPQPAVPMKSNWAASLIRVGFGSTELTVEADSLEEALMLGEQQACNQYIPEENYSWGVSSLTCEGQPVAVPTWARMPDSDAGHSHVERKLGRAKYTLCVTREGIGHAEWQHAQPLDSIETACSLALDHGGNTEKSESASNYLIDVLHVEFIAV